MCMSSGYMIDSAAMARHAQEAARRHQDEVKQREHEAMAAEVIRQAYRNPDASFRVDINLGQAVYRPETMQYETVPMRVQVRERLRQMPIEELEEHLAMCKLSIEEAKAIGLSNLIKDL